MYWVKWDRHDLLTGKPLIWKQTHRSLSFMGHNDIHVFILTLFLEIKTLVPV
jgi:hypothetical protein